MHQILAKKGSIMSSSMTQGEKIGTQISPWVWIFWTIPFYNLIKNSHQDQSNEGSNFIMSLLEVGQ